MIENETIDRTTKVVLNLSDGNAEGIVFVLYDGGTCIAREFVTWRNAMPLIQQIRMKVINDNPDFDEFMFVESDENDNDEETS